MAQAHAGMPRLKDGSAPDGPLARVPISKALERTPNRTRSVRGLERARRNSSNVGLLMK